MSASLPPGWARYTTDEGKEYFHNASTNTTQWDKPAWPEGLGHTDHAEVFEYKPTASDLEVTPTATLAATNDLSATPQALGASPSAGGANTELVSLHGAPTGKIGSAPQASGGSGQMFGGLSMGSGGGAAGSSGDAASSNDQGGIGGISGWLLNSAQSLFDVTTDDVVGRLKMVLLPYPPLPDGSSAKEELRSRPDFYGPFWVATTAVLFLAATGNFTRLLQAGDHTQFKADYSLVSVAAGIVYGCLVAVPLIVRASLFVSGEEVNTVDFKQMICICGYSLAPTIPASLLCILPSEFLRWLIVLAGLALSLYFLRGHLIIDGNVKAQWLKWTLIIGPCVPPAVIFLHYKIFLLK